MTDITQSPPFYERDLAYIHDVGYGRFARGSAPGLLQYLREAQIHDGRIVDVGCGSGIWARLLVDAGYEVIGVDRSSAMIDIARARAVEATFFVAPYAEFVLPQCRAITAIGEVFNYFIEADNALPSVEANCRRAFEALAPEGLLIFDVAEPGRSQDKTQAITEGDDWTCLVEYRHETLRQQLIRRIVTFRQIGNGYRRHEEVHHLQLVAEDQVRSILESIGFHVQTVRSYGSYAFPDHVVGFIARK